MTLKDSTRLLTAITNFRLHPTAVSPEGKKMSQWGIFLFCIKLIYKYKDINIIINYERINYKKLVIFLTEKL